MMPVGGASNAGGESVNKRNEDGSGQRGRLAGCTALITGASKGIGRAIVQAFAAEGCQVALAATSTEELQELAKDVEGKGGTARVEPLDVRRRDDCFAVVKRIVANFGKIDILVNAAGIHIASQFLDYEFSAFQATFDVNVNGPIHLMQAVLPGMIERKRGKIVNIASTAGKWASPNQSAYNASKHALVGLTRCVAVEVAPHGVNVNAICPGLVRTKLMTDSFSHIAEMNNISLDEALAPIIARTSLKRILEPEEIAHLAVYLASTESDGMTGQSIVIDSGMLFI
jgi:meso-butanediol dehydrogenase / (S,S)-butanediol dehydrogenase / diacetyl reductase